jgi:hypothetical protein
MKTTKASFTLDQVAMEKLQDAATRLALSKSEIVRKAILEFHDRLGRLSERERLTMLCAFDELVPKIPTRGAAAVSREMAAVRQGRRSGDRRTLEISNDPMEHVY